MGQPRPLVCVRWSKVGADQVPTLLNFFSLSLTLPLNMSQRAFLARFPALDMYYTTLRIRNLQKIDSFRRKLVPFLLPVTNKLAWTNTQAYYRICTLQICYIFLSTGPWSYYLWVRQGASSSYPRGEHLKGTLVTSGLTFQILDLAGKAYQGKNFLAYWDFSSLMKRPAKLAFFQASIIFVSNKY